MANETHSLKLYRGWPNQGEYVWSPFVIKLEARFRFAGISYGIEAGSPRTAPKGKVPFVEFQAAKDAGSTRLGDSTLIVKHLVETGVLPNLNGSLSMEDKARDLATRALLEDKLYFFHTRERWIENYYPMRDYALSSIPWPARVFVGQLIYRSSKAMLNGQGTLRFSDDETRTIKNEIWQSISEVLLSVRSKTSPSRNTNASGSKSSPALFWFLGGDQPTEIDATLFGFIVSVLLCTAGPESRKIVDRYPILTDYAERIHDMYFPDYKKWECHRE